METLKHWTSKSTAEFAFRISSDFVGQLEVKMEDGGTSRTELARRLDVTIGRVSQVLNDPGNLTLRNTVGYANALGLKVAIVAYEDQNDPDNEKGPINAEIFRQCWKRAGEPRDLFQLAHSESYSESYLSSVGGAPPPFAGAVSFFAIKAGNGNGRHPLPEKDYGIVVGQKI